MLACGLLGVAAPAATDASPAAAQDLACAAGETRADVTELFFGRSVDGRLAVTEARWQGFLLREITPRFPDGLTVLDASGQWRDPASRRFVREASKLVVIVTPADAPAGTETRDARVAEIVDAYKRSFRQHSVLVVRRPACARF